MPTFCSHPECLDRELAFLVEIEAKLWRQSQDHRVPYQRLSARFRGDFAPRSTHQERR